MIASLSIIASTQIYHLDRPKETSIGFETRLIEELHCLARGVDQRRLPRVRFQIIQMPVGNGRISTQTHHGPGVEARRVVDQKNIPFGVPWPRKLLGVPPILPWRLSLRVSGRHIRHEVGNEAGDATALVCGNAHRYAVRESLDDLGVPGSEVPCHNNRPRKSVYVIPVQHRIRTASPNPPWRRVPQPASLGYKDEQPRVSLLRHVNLVK